MQAVARVEIAITRNLIKKIMVDPGQWQERIQQVLGFVRPLISFDRATFGIYGENVSLFRPVYIEPSTAAKWPSLWVEVPEGVRLWLTSGKTWASDLEEFVSTGRRPRRARNAQS